MVIMVGDLECSIGVVPTPAERHHGTQATAQNYGSYGFAYRVGHRQQHQVSSALGNLGGPVQADGTITARDIATNASDRVTNFSTIMNLTLTNSTFALDLGNVRRRELSELF